MKGMVFSTPRRRDAEKNAILIAILATRRLGVQTSK
jgi:hypothetical protein